MAIQRESLLIASPFKVTLRDRGWHVENISGNQFQQGLPDAYICHPRYGPRWVEFKVFDKYWKIHLTRAQKIKFPILISNGVPIYVIAAKDLRGKENEGKRDRLYKKLFDEPNGQYALSPRLYSFLK